MRFVKWFLGVVVLLWILAYAWLSYRRHYSYQTLIHPEASSLIRIQVDGLLKSVCWNALAHPAYYRKLWKSPAGTSVIRETDKSGLVIPANVFLYTIKGLPGAWFTSFAVDDSAAFKRYLNRQWGMENIKPGAGGLFSAGFANGNIGVAFTEKKAVFSGSLRPLPAVAERVCLDLLNGTAGIPVSETDFYSRVKGERHVVWASADATASLQFDNGLISLDALGHTDLLRGADSLRPKKFKENSLFKGWLDADIRPLISKYAAFFEGKGMPADSLNKYFGGYLEAEWMDSTLVQRDTVVTYAYNDDFEKTEKRSVREERVPKFYVAIKASPHLAGYLPSRLFYQLHSGHRSDLLYVGTGQRFSDERLQRMSTDFLYVFTDLDRIRKAGAVPRIAAYTRSAKQLELRARQREDGAIILHAGVRWPLPGIHSLVQLVQ